MHLGGENVHEGNVFAAEEVGSSKLAETEMEMVVVGKELIRKTVKSAMNGTHLNKVIKRFLNNYVGSQWNRSVELIGPNTRNLIQPHLIPFNILTR